MASGVLRARVGGVWVDVPTTGPQGPVGPTGPPGADGEGAVQFYRHVQVSPSAVWLINHPLTFRPNVVLVDSLGREFIADIEYLNDTTIRVTLSAGVAGEAYLS